MPDVDPRALELLYNRYDCRPLKHLLEAALTGKSQVEIAIDTMSRMGRWFLDKADDSERSARLAARSQRSDAAQLYRNHREDATFYRRAAGRQYAGAHKLEAERRDAEGRAA